MKNNELIEVYKQHENLLWDRAWSWNRTTGHDVEELFGECRVQFFLLIELWDAEKMKLSSFLTMCLNQHLNTYTHKTDLPMEETEEISNVLFTALNPRDSLCFKEMIESMSSQGQYVCRLLLENTDRLKIKPNMSIKAVRGAIRDHLREIGWTWDSIWDTFTEVKQALCQ